MLSKSQISFIKSLHQKKYRKESGFFIIEGIKSITEFINSPYGIHSIYYTSQFFDLLPKNNPNIRLFEATHAELTKISALQTPQGILAIVHLPTEQKIDIKSLSNCFSLVLDDIQDPGNLGTIIRTADWFGIDQIVCSPVTVEWFNPKVIQATMGAFIRVKVFYTELGAFLKTVRQPVVAADLQGSTIYDHQFANPSVILMGSESHGIPEELSTYITDRLTIPSFGETESLNVAIATGIFCYALRSR